MEATELEAAAWVAYQDGNYDQAVRFQQEAVLFTRERIKLIAREAQLEVAREAATLKRRQTADVQRGHAYFAKEQYEQAVVAWKRARSNSAEVDYDLMYAAEAGRYLIQARGYWHEDQDWRHAQQELDNCIVMATSNPAAEQIGRAANDLRAVIEQHVEAYRGLREHISLARRRLAESNLPGAVTEAQNALAQAPDNVEVRTLLRDIERRTHVEGLLVQARGAMTVGAYEQVRAIAGTMVEKEYDSDEAMILFKQVTGGWNQLEQDMRSRLGRNPSDQHAWSVVTRIASFKKMVLLQESVKTLHDTIDKAYSQLTDEQQDHRRSILQRVNLWKRLSVVGALIAFTVFITSWVFWLQGLAPGYSPVFGLIPTVTSALIFSHYKDENTRLDQSMAGTMDQVRAMDTQIADRLKERISQIEREIQALTNQPADNE